MNDSLDVVVVGGGISGLTVGYWLAREGLDVRVLEAQPAVGGVVRTWRESGFLFELGPNTVLDSRGAISRLSEALGIDSSRIAADERAKRRYIVRGGKLLPLPAGPRALLTTRLFSLGAKLRLLREPFVSRAAEEESIASFARRRLGRELLDYALAPFVAGVHAGDPERLSVRHATPKLHALERDHGSLLRGAMAKRRGASPRGSIFSFRDGLETLPRAIAGALDERLRTGTRVLGLGVLGLAASDRGAWRVEVETGGGTEILSARAVVCAVPAPALASMLAPFAQDPDGFAGAIGDLPYADVAVVSLGFRRDEVAHPLDGFGFLAPEVEGRHLLGCLFPSSLFPDRAPEGHVALSAFVGGALHSERAHDEPATVLAASLRDLGPLLGLRAEPRVARVERWCPAIPQYELGHGEHLERARGFEAAHPGIFISGNLLHGISLSDCVENASALAGRVRGYLAR